MAFKLQAKIRDLIPFQLEINGNFSVWKYCMNCILVSLNLLGYVDGSLERQREGLEVEDEGTGVEVGVEGVEVGGDGFEHEDDDLENEDVNVEDENESVEEDFEGLQHQEEDFEGRQHQDEDLVDLQHQPEGLEGLQHQQHQDDLEDAENRRRDSNDKAVMALINSTLDPSVLAQVTHCTSSRILWLKLESIFYGRKEFKVRSLENKLKSFKKARPVPMETYISEVEKVRAELASLGKDLSIDGLRATVLQNLDPHFRTAVQDREIPISINEFYLLLLLEEAKNANDPRLDYYS